MAASTLHLSLTELRNEVGSYLGYGPDYSSYASAEQTKVNRAINAGTRKFYFPVFSDGTSWEWNFLKIVTTIATVANDEDQDLPDPFGGLIGSFTFASSDNRNGPIRVVGENQIRAMREGGNTSTGQPRFAAIRAKTNTGATDQDWEVMWYPTPDAVYTLSYKYKVLQDAMTSSGSLLFPLGGMAHSETLKACCNAAAEELFNDGQQIWKGIMKECLQASRFHDSQMEREFYGQMLDQSDCPIRYIRNKLPASYNGVFYP